MIIIIEQQLYFVDGRRPQHAASMLACTVEPIFYEHHQYQIISSMVPVWDNCPIIIFLSDWDMDPPTYLRSIQRGVAASWKDTMVFSMYFLDEQDNDNDRQ